MVADLPVRDLDGPQVLADRIASRLRYRSFRAWHGRDPLVDPCTPPSVTAQASTITCGEADSAAGLRIPVPAFRPRSRVVASAVSSATCIGRPATTFATRKTPLPRGTISAILRCSLIGAERFEPCKPVSA